jgi:hypothetical protein
VTPRSGDGLTLGTGRLVEGGEPMRTIVRGSLRHAVATWGPGRDRGVNRIDSDDVSKRHRVGEVEVDALVEVDSLVDEASFVVIVRKARDRWT